MGSTSFKRTKIETLKPSIHALRFLLDLHSTKLISEDYPDQDAYLYLPEYYTPTEQGEINNFVYHLLRSGYLSKVPITIDNKNYYMLDFLPEDYHESYSTVSSSHIRCPLLSYITLLTPADFFLIFDIINASKMTKTITTISINFGELNLVELPPSVEPIFQLVTQNKISNRYKLTTQFTSPHWIPRSELQVLSSLSQTAESQLYAIQYLTKLCRLPHSPRHIPIETAIALELPIASDNGEYAIEN